MYYKNKKLAKRKKKMVLKDIHLGLGYQSFIPHKLPMVASEKLVLKHSSFPPVWLRPIPDLWAGEVVSSSGVCYEAVLTGIGLSPRPTTVTITYLNKVCFVLLDLQNPGKALLRTGPSVVGGLLQISILCWVCLAGRMSPCSPCADGRSDTTPYTSLCFPLSYLHSSLGHQLTLLNCIEIINKAVFWIFT